ncbi:MAG TPA: autotransporter-associated beta strand repeat-containing protein [Chthoniobacteraceae bacterium]|jgi:autotransporter-associated beta strand protein|nr:autotransporter-associated beta strand repeat-containing protein [Chthoniobacteraceae bacterium]
MRWILPLLSLALVHSAFGEIAVYTGLLSVENVSTPGRPTLLRVADVIDLSTGKIVTVGLTGGRTDFSYAVGPEVDYVIAKTDDSRGHGVTVIAQASTNTDVAGSKFANASSFRGQDATVHLSAAGASHWPRTLIGSGSLVAAVGTDPVATPAGASFSKTVLVLNESLSQAANAAGGTLTEAAQIVAQQFRDRAGALLKFTPGSVNVVAGTSDGTLGGTVNAGLVKTGAGALLFGAATSFTGATTINGGILRIDPGAVQLGGATTTIGGSLQLSGSNLNLGGSVSTISIANPVLGGIVNTIPNIAGVIAVANPGATLTFTGGTLGAAGSLINAGTGALSITRTVSGALTLAGTSGAAVTTALNPFTGATVTIGSTEWSSLIAGQRFSATVNADGVLALSPIPASGTLVTGGTLTIGGTTTGGVITVNNNGGLTGIGGTLSGITLNTGGTVGSGGVISVGSNATLTLNTVPSVINFPSTSGALVVSGGLPITSLPVGLALTSATTLTGVPLAGGDTFLTNAGPNLTALLTANPNLAAYTLNGGTLAIVGAGAALTRTGDGTLVITRASGITTTVNAGSIVPVTLDPAAGTP